MKRQPVKSSNLVSVGFEHGVLEIEFRGNKIYQYTDVPESLYAKLISAESVGKFFETYIRSNRAGKLVK